jgi:hypothetical protein
MINETRSVQLEQIVRHLAALPGGQAVDIFFRRLPRFGPWGLESGYQMDQRSFGTRDMPASVDIPADSDELLVRLRGLLPPDEPQAKTALVDEFYSMFSDSELSNNWEVRTQFKNGGSQPPRYELTVFPHVKPAVAEPLA